MASTGGERSSRVVQWAACAVATLAGLTACTWLPNEFNLSPIYRHRVDERGEVLELDVLWPIVHYERTAEGGTDFRIRPFYRYVTEPDAPPEMSPADGPPDAGLAATEHQFIWPLGRVRTDAEQRTMRLWPIWGHTSRLDDLGLRETDWFFAFPFIWGGSREDGAENYFGFFPFYADLPDFLTYERFHAVLFPLYLGLEKIHWKSHIFLWPFIGFGRGDDGFWHRVLPLYSYYETDEWRRWSVAWPFIHWGTERRNSDDPVSRFWLWPLIGRQWSERVSAWSFLWPFFQYIELADRKTKIDFLWPIFRFEHDTSEHSPLWQWWVFPLVARTITDDQWAWNFLWPLIWISEYADPEGRQFSRWFLPFFRTIWRVRDDGSEDEYTQVWPLWHSERNHDGRADWSVPSLWPKRAGNAYGVAEAYDWIWTLAKGRTRASGDTSVEWAGNLFTSRQRGAKYQSSVPLLFNYESDADGGVIRLLQFIPIRVGGRAQSESPQ